MCLCQSQPPNLSLPRFPFVNRKFETGTHSECLFDMNETKLKLLNFVLVSSKLKNGLFILELDLRIFVPCIFSSQSPGVIPTSPGLPCDHPRQHAADGMNVLVLLRRSSPYVMFHGCYFCSSLTQYKRSITVWNFQMGRLKSGRWGHSLHVHHSWGLQSHVQGRSAPRKEFWLPGFRKKPHLCLRLALVWSTWRARDVKFSWVFGSLLKWPWEI